MKVIRWLYDSWFSPKTISFWAALLGIATYKKRKLSTLLLFLVGIGGMGVSYGRFCDKNHVGIEPVAAFRAALRTDVVDLDIHAKEFASHALFAGIGVWRYLSD